jgi:hypothetical protein
MPCHQSRKALLSFPALLGPASRSLSSGDTGPPTHALTPCWSHNLSRGILPTSVL